VLDLPRLGAINIHASLLPRWRGAAPIQRAILAGDTETGISIMRMDAGLDTGPVLIQKAVPITDEETAQSLHDKLAALGASLIVEALSVMARAGLAEQPQPVQGVTYASKLNKAEARIDWSLPAQQVDRSIRAFSPFPGAHSTLKGAELKLWKATPSAVPADGPAALPGTVLAADAAGVRVACGDGMLIIRELQRPGARRLAAAEFLRGFPIASGDRFGA
jgi:methionyl-tRNA formyltransferase